MLVRTRSTTSGGGRNWRIARLTTDSAAWAPWPRPARPCLDVWRARPRRAWAWQPRAWTWRPAENWKIASLMTNSLQRGPIGGSNWKFADLMTNSVAWVPWPCAAWPCLDICRACPRQAWGMAPEFAEGGNVQSALLMDARRHRDRSPAGAAVCSTHLAGR